MQANLKWEPEWGSVGGEGPGTRGAELLYGLHKLLEASSTPQAMSQYIQVLDPSTGEGSERIGQKGMARE
jgi:hypothetical protein